MCGGRFDEAIFGRYFGVDCLKGLVLLARVYKLEFDIEMYSLGGVYVGSEIAEVLDESWKTDWKTGRLKRKDFVFNK